MNTKTIWGALIVMVVIGTAGVIVFLSGWGAKVEYTAPELRTSEHPAPSVPDPATGGSADADTQIVCPQDAKRCQDGSYVSRVAPACEFAVCPGGSAPTTAAVAPVIPVTLESQAFADTKDGFRINVPKGWTQDVKKTTPMFLSPKQDAQGALKFSANLSTSAIPLKLSGVSDLDHCITGVELAKILPNYRTTEDQKTTVNGLPVRIIGGTFDYGDYHLRNKQLLAIKNGKYYTITVTALASTWDAYEDAFQSSFLTFDAN